MVECIIKRIIETKDFSSFNRLNKVSNILFDKDDEDYEKLLSAINDYVVKYNSFPSMSSLESILELYGDKSLISLFNDISSLNETACGSDIDPGALLDALVKNVAKERLSSTMKKLSDELEDLSISKVDSAIDGYIELMRNYKQIVSDDSVEEIDIKEDPIVVQELEYLNEEDDRYSSSFGVPELDDFLDIKMGDQMFGFLAPPKSFKSSFSRFLVYKQILQGNNCLFISLEMDLNTIKRHFYCLHANNKDMWGNTSPTIRFNDIKKKKLDSEQKDFYIDAIKDFSSNPDYGNLVIEFPRRFLDLEGFKQLVLESKKKFDNKLDIVLLDYVTILTPKLGRRTTFEDINQMIKELRLFMLENGIILWTPIQTNRGGFTKLKSSDKDIHLLDMSDIGQYSEIEKSFTDVIGINTNPILKKSGILRINSLLHRECPGLPDDGLFAKFDVDTGWFIFNPSEEPSEDQIVNIVEQINI